MRGLELKQIRALPLFWGMTDAHFQALMEGSSLQRFAQGTVLVHEGQLPSYLHILLEGAVETFATYDGHTTIIDIIKPVSPLVLAAIVRDEVYLKSGRTLTGSHILKVPAKKVREIYQLDLAFARAVIDELAIRCRVLVRELKNQKLRTSVTRLANWILCQGMNHNGQNSFMLGHDKRTLAAHLGMTPENLSRNLAMLAEHGVESTGREIRIQDRDALRRFAKPDELIDGL